jgi:hypothetical protein
LGTSVKLPSWASQQLGGGAEARSIEARPTTQAMAIGGPHDAEHRSTHPTTIVVGPSFALACDPSVVDGVGWVSQPAWMRQGGNQRVRKPAPPSLMVWGGFPNPPRCAKEGTSGLGNPLHRFLLSTTTD